MSVPDSAPEQASSTEPEDTDDNSGMYVNTKLIIPPMI